MTMGSQVMWMSVETSWVTTVKAANCRLSAFNKGQRKIPRRGGEKWIASKGTKLIPEAAGQRP
jgi:hypothetical protein